MAKLRRAIFWTSKPLHPNDPPEEKQKNESPFFVPKIIVFWFLKWRAKNVRLGKNQSKKGGKKGTLQEINISHLGKRKIIFKMPFLGDMLVPWRVHPMCLALKVSCIQNCHDLSRFRLPSQFHHDAFHDLEVMEPKQIQHVFLFKMDLFQKIIGIWWDLFELVLQIPPKRIRSTRLCVLASERLKESLLHFVKLYAGKGWFPAPHQSIVLWSKSRCSGVLALFRTPPTRMVDWLQKLRVAVLPFQVFYNHTVAPVKDPTRLLFDLLVSLRFFVPFAHILVCRPKINGQPPKKRVGFSVTSENQRVKRNCPWRIWGHPAGWKAITSQPIGPSHTTSPVGKGGKMWGILSPTGLGTMKTGLDVWKLVGKSADPVRRAQSSFLM